VEFVKTDTTTQGTWKGVYGSDGYEICNNAISYPGYESITITPTTSFGTWAASTTDVRALQKAATGSTDRIAAYRTVGAAWGWNCNPSDGKWHQIALYMLDWDNVRSTTQVKVIDVATGTVLDYRHLRNFSQGKYLVWNVYGNVRVEVSETSPAGSWVASGIFFDPIPTPTPALGWWKLNETSGALAADSSGLGQTATQSGATWDAAGEINGCLNMSGVSCYLGQPVNVFRTANVDRTYATWFRTSTAGPIVGTQNTPQPSAPTQYAPILYVGDDGKLYGSYMCNTSTAPMVSTTTVNDNNWHHVALVRSGAFQTMYLDGNIVGNLAGTIPLGWTYAWMGMSYVSGWPHITGSPAYFTGRLDDVRIYDRAVGPGEIWKLAHP